MNRDETTIINHSNPIDYGITIEEGKLMRLNYIYKETFGFCSSWDQIGLIELTRWVCLRKELFGTKMKKSSAIASQIREILHKADYKYQKRELKLDIDCLNIYFNFYLQHKGWFPEMMRNEIFALKEKKEKRLYFLKKSKGKNIKQFDIPYIKTIPINTITEIMPNGFFRENPFREERSPSNSLYWNKKNNTWVDYGSGEHGDIIDLVMKLYDLSFVEACKKLCIK